MTLEDYAIFKKAVEAIAVDTYVLDPIKEKVVQGDYFFQEGLWTNFEKIIYFYDRQRIAKHKEELLALCKCLPKFHQPTDQHAGTINSFDLLTAPKHFNSLSAEEMFHQMTLSHHFANLLCGADIASIAPVTDGENKAFLIVLDNAYRAYLV